MNTIPQNAAGQTRPALSRMLYKKTSFSEYGDRSYYERALSMVTIHFNSFVNIFGWRITIDIRSDGIDVLALINKRPLEMGNVYEEVEVWEGKKFLPPEAFD